MDSQAKTIQRFGARRVAFRQRCDPETKAIDTSNLHRNMNAFFEAVRSPIAFAQGPVKNAGQTNAEPLDLRMSAITLETGSFTNQFPSKDASRLQPEPRQSSAEFSDWSVVPSEQLLLDGARKARIPWFMSAWFDHDENEMPNDEDLVWNSEISNVSNSNSEGYGNPSAYRFRQTIAYKDLTLGGTLGEGAFGKVYKGKWGKRDVAIKMLNCQEIRNDILAEFQAEVEIMSVLRHPNICRLLGACMEAPHCALVVELLEYGSLWNVLRLKRRTLTMEMRTKFLLDTANGMNYLHHFNRPILHRDLKSPNLLVNKDYTIKIADFGLARVKAHVQTMTGNCGTVQWMAPEVLGNLNYTEKADVFSFGIVIWEVLTGECPYAGTSQVQVALGVLNRNIRPTIPPNCPPFFARLMKTCWNRNPLVRPSFSQIIKALTSYQANQDRMFD